MKIAKLVGAALVAASIASAASAATYSTQASFLAANPGLGLVSFSGQTPSLSYVGPTSLGGLGFTGPNLYFVDTAFWGSVDSLLDNTFNGFLTVTTAPSSAVGFYFASSYQNGTSIDFTAYNGASVVYASTLTGGGVQSSFSYFGLDGVGPITSFTLSSAPYAGGFASIAEISSGNAVPEPASWALLIAGFGLTGAAMRRRRAALAA